MRMERIAPQRPAPVPERAQLIYQGILKRDVKKRPRLYLYTLRGPAARQLFTSEESLRTYLGSVPRLRLRRIERIDDHDLVHVFGLAHNVLSRRATRQDRAVAREFLSDLGAIAGSERSLPQIVREACAAFCAEHGMDLLEWKECQYVKVDRRKPDRKKKRGVFHKIVATRYARADTPSATYDSTFENGSLTKPLRALVRICNGTLPFRYEAGRA